MWGYTAYSDANQPLPPDNNPATVFNRVFAASAAILRCCATQAERKTVLDAVMASYNSLKPKLGAVDKVKLDPHLRRSAISRRGCTAPTVGAAA